VFKRTIWFTIGTGVGLGSSVYARRRLRRKIERYHPEQAARRATASAKALGADVLAAAREGRAAMREREASLRAHRR